MCKWRRIGIWQAAVPGVRLGAVAILAAVLLLAACQYAARSQSGVPGSLNLSDFGAAGAGGDDTQVFQTALAAAASAGQPLHVAASSRPYKVRPLFLLSNTTLLLDAGVVIEAAPGFGPTEKLFNLENVSNIQISGSGAVLRMRKQEYISSEYRHCMELQGVTNVSLKGFSCNDSGGDGLYIGPGNQGFSRNVIVQGCRFFNNRRQGMSITGAIGVHIQHSYFVGTRGTPGESGIDIEPNTSSNPLQDIHIEDSVTDSNKGDGLSIYLGNLTSASPPVDITVFRHHSGYNSGAGFSASYETNGNIPGVSGRIVVDQGTSDGNGTYGAVASFYSSSGPALTFRNLYVSDANQSRSTYDNAAIAIKRGGGGIGPMGNVNFLNPTIIDTTGKLDYYFTLRDFSNVGFAHVQISAPVLAYGAAHAQPYGLVQGQGASSVSIP